MDVNSNNYYGNLYNHTMDTRELLMKDKGQVIDFGDPDYAFAVSGHGDFSDKAIRAIL